MSSIPFREADVRPWNRRAFPFDRGPDVAARYWTNALAFLPGIGPTKLLTAARDIAVERARPIPADLGDLGDPELVSAVRLWLDARAEEKGTRDG